MTKWTLKNDISTKLLTRRSKITDQTVDQRSDAAVDETLIPRVWNRQIHIRQIYLRSYFLSIESRYRNRSRSACSHNPFKERFRFNTWKWNFSRWKIKTSKQTEPVAMETPEKSSAISPSSVCFCKTNFPLWRCFDLFFPFDVHL